MDLLTFDAVCIHPGIRVVFERWGGERALEGVVRVTEPAGYTKVSALGVKEQRIRVIAAFTSPASQWQRPRDAEITNIPFLAALTDALRRCNPLV